MRKIRITLLRGVLQDATCLAYHWGPAGEISSAGTSGMYSNWSILQVNATVPSGLGPGPQPVVLKIGSNDNSRQAVVMWVY